MRTLSRITLDPNVMGGKPCIRGMRATVGNILGLLASDHSESRILEAYPYLEPEDLREALAYAMGRVEETHPREGAERAAASRGGSLARRRG